MKYDTSIHMNPDANAWAKFFMQVMQDNPNIVIDEGLMIGWFANAMMAMHDHLNGGGPINGDHAQHIAQQAAREPVAYFDFQEHGFYWSPNVKIGDVPVIRKVAPMPLYSEPDMYKKSPKTNISQERVQKTGESMQVPLRQAQIIAMYDVACDVYVTQDARAIEFARAVEKYHGIGAKT